MCFVNVLFLDILSPVKCGAQIELITYFELPKNKINILNSIFCVSRILFGFSCKIELKHV